jgi:hypothetical protein
MDAASSMLRGFGLDRHVRFFDRNEFRECTDAPVSRPRIDFVAGRESTHGAVAGSEVDGPQRASDARWMAKKLLAG